MLNVLSKKLFLAIIVSAAAVLPAITPSESHACACGCGVFDVGTGYMLPSQKGGRMFIEDAYLNQNKSRNGDSHAPAADNEDKVIRTHFLTVGVQYMFDRAWGAEMDLPFVKRHVSMEDEISGDIESMDHYGLGDIRMKGIYSGFSEDMSSGVTFGLKMPTGDYNKIGFERDIQIGTGSTDVLLGAYHMGNIGGLWKWFGNVQLSLPFLTHGEYRPGGELNGAAGVYYGGWKAGGIRMVPIAQLINTYRWHDSGLEASSANSGYEMLVFSPGVELDYGDMKINGNVGVPVYDYVRGNQLVAPALFKLSVSQSF